MASGSSETEQPPHPTDTEKATSPTAATGPGPVQLSARQLHALALESFRVGNRGRLSLCEALRVLDETRLYFDLGFPSLAAYAGTFFQLRRAEAFEYVRVARSLVELTRLREAFGQGRLGWSALKAITRVASVASQASWIEFASRNGVDRTVAEVRQALRAERDAPREGAYGLPNLDQKLVLRFSHSDMDKIRGWIEDACSTVRESTGAGEVTLEQALLFLCEQDAAGESSPDDEKAPGRVARRAQLVYQHCADCRKTRMATGDGFVEVSADELERYRGSAETVVIDGPTPPPMRRRILAREAGRCGNPRCHHRANHCHHIVFLSQGGSTSLANEVAVCRTCHALIHAGLLRVLGRADGELRWSPATAPDTVRQRIDSQTETADRLPVLSVASFERGAAAHRPEGSRQSAFADSAPSNTMNRDSLDVDALAGGLIRLGVSSSKSKRLVEAAIATLTPGERTESAVLRAAVGSI